MVVVTAAKSAVTAASPGPVRVLSAIAPVKGAELRDVVQLQRHPRPAAAANKRQSKPVAVYPAL